MIARGRAAAVGAALATVACAGLAAAASRPTAPAADRVRVGTGSLHVRDARGEWRAWWSARSAPVRWTQPSTALAGAVRWHAARPGLEWAELPMAISVDGPRATLGTTLRVRVVLVRLDPARMTLALHAVSRPEGGAGAWDVSRAPAAAALALNAGQFTDDGPWGWVVHRGRELQPRGVGALAGALVIDTAGRARVVGAGTLDGLHAAARGGAVVEAVQSYPMLLDDDGALPRALRAHGQGVDLAHRDARLAVGELPDGRVLVALTRFDALGTTLGAVPIGLTVPETSALMGALGCRTAMMLDGGLSAQLLLRDAAGEARRWDGLRDVPLGLVATSGR